jgi:uncharacterized protein YndB with AHSA1/START domain
MCATVREGWDEALLGPQWAAAEALPGRTRPLRACRFRPPPFVVHAEGHPLFPGFTMTNSVRFHRVLRAPPERVYRAFLDADAMAKWLPPNGFTGKVHQLDAKVGRSYRMSFTNFTTGASHSFGGEYLELVPHERIRYTARFDDPNLPGVMQTTVSLRAVFCGTEMNVVQEGIPEVIPPEACYMGWQESLVLMAELVEAEIRE